MGESTQMKSGATWRKVVVRAYLVSLGLAVLITVLTTLTARLGVGCTVAGWSGGAGR